MNNLLMWVAGLLVAAFAALFAVPPLVDWNQYRGVFEEEASRLLGREVRVGGAVNLRILPVPYVSFEKVSISDAPGLSGAFLRAERFTMLLSAPPLLRGVMEARQLEIDSPEIRIRFNEQGGGNWQQLELRERELAFVPTDVSLQSAMIRNGRIILLSKDDRQIAALESVTGDLSAKGLRGPYKFNGSLNIGKAEHVLRLSTASMDANGQLRFKLSARSKATDTQHKIDGSIQNLTTTPSVSGKLDSRGPVRVGKRDTGSKPTFYDLSAQLSLNTKAADLSEMSISFDSAGRPQLLVGAARATWDNGLRLASKLSSQWLDLDAISSGKTVQSPAQALAFLTGDAIHTGPNGQTNLQLELGQASLGGEVVSDLNVRLVEQAGRFRVDHISALLPGRTRFRANGRVLMLEDRLGGDGQLLLNGRSLDKFLGWLRLEAGELKGRAAGEFQFSANVAVQPKNVTISAARMQFATGVSRGSFEFDWNATPRIKLQADGEHIDVSSLGAGLLAPESIAYLLGGDQSKNTKPSPALQFLGEHDLDLDLNVRDMTDGVQKLTNVGIRMSRTDRQIRFARSRLTFEPGLELEIEGEIDQGKTGALWDLSGLVEVKNAGALEKLHGLVGDIIKQPERPRFLWRASPIKAAFATKSTSEQDGGNASLSLDGTIGTERLRFSVSSAGPAGAWRDNPLQAELKIDGYAEQALKKLLNWEPAVEGSIDTVTSGNSAGSAVPSLFRLKVSGIPNQQLAASAALAGDAWQLRLRSKGKPSSDGQGMDWTGTGWVQAGDIRQAVQTTSPVWLQLVRTSGGIEGDFHFQRQKTGQLSLEPIQVRIGDSRVSGRLALSAADNQRVRPKISGRLSFDQIDALPIYLALLKSDRPFEQAADGRAGSSEPLPLWPDSPFNLAALGMFDANVQVAAARLKLSSSLTARDTKSEIVIADGALDVRLTQGRLLRGALSGSGKLSPEQAGAKLVADIKLQNASLKNLASDEALVRKLDGRADVQIKAEGQALSPRALAIALAGTGSAKVKGARVPGLAPVQLSKVADSVVLAEANAEDLGKEIDELVTAGIVNVGSQAMQLSLRDGTLTVSPFGLGKGQALPAMNRTSIDVVRGIIDSRWEVATQLKRAIAEGVDPRKSLPPVLVTYSGVLGRLATVAPRVSIGDLQRELTVQRMENDVRRLERQRRDDEKRARAEEERLRRLEQERLKALEEERRKRQFNLPQPAAVPVNPSNNALTGQPQFRPTAPNQRRSLSDGTTGRVERQTLPPVAPGSGAVPNTQSNGAQLPNGAAGQAAGGQGTGLQPPVATAPPSPRRVRRKPPTQSWRPFGADN